MVSALETGAVLRFGFRARRPKESEPQYRAALIEFVRDYDVAAAFELRLGRVQAEWSADEVTAFTEHLRTQYDGPRETMRPGAKLPSMHEFKPVETVNNAALLELADDNLSAAMQMRQRSAKRALPILATVMLTDGRIQTTPVNRDDRLAVLKELANSRPVFGYLVVFDAFMHNIDQNKGTATKKDAIIAHVGSRDDLRVFKRRPYRIVLGRAVFDEPPPPDFDKHSPDWVVEKDPYATIFALPLSGGVPS